MIDYQRLENKKKEIEVHLDQCKYYLAHIPERDVTNQVRLFNIEIKLALEKVDKLELIMQDEEMDRMF